MWTWGQFTFFIVLFMVYLFGTIILSIGGNDNDSRITREADTRIHDKAQDS